MVSYFVRYRGAVFQIRPHSAAITRSQHAEILKQFPNIRSLVLHRPAAWNDPFPVRRGETLLLAQMQFDSAATSTQRCAPRRDVWRATTFSDFRRSTAKLRMKP